MSVIGSALAIAAEILKYYMKERDKKKKKEFADALAKRDTDTVTRMLNDVLRS